MAEHFTSPSSSSPSLPPNPPLQTLPQIHPSISPQNPNPNPSSVLPPPLPNPPLPNSTSNINPNLNELLPLPFPRKRRRGRVPRTSISINSQVFLPSHLSSNASFNNGSTNKELASSSSNVSTSATSTSSFTKPTVENSVHLPTTSSDISEEIIFINKEATSEALTALTSGFPADSLTEEEIEAGVVSAIGGIEQVNYTLIRNHILTKWRENVSNWLTKESLIGSIPPHCSTLLNSAYNFLVSRGYVNFGVAPAIKGKIPAEGTKANVIVIGAGLAGLAAARQLMAFGFKVTVLEGRKRAGGRVYTKKLEGSNKTAAADLGGSVLTGTLGNPLGILARQLSYSLHKVRDKCPIYRPDGNPVDPDTDSKVETAFNRLLDKASRLRQLMGEVSVDVSLGSALETFREVYGDAVNAEELSLFNWHLANLEYANAGLLSKLSLAFWDQDDPYDMGGDHCFLPGGNGRLVQALADNLPILYEKTVHTIRYGNDGVQVVTGSQVYEGDMALCTVPLGVLKSGSIKFVPELPQRKLDGIKRLGFGLLNKVAMLFPHVFWGTELDTFGHLCDDTSRRGEFFLFYSYATVAGGPLLIALVAGEAAHKFESMPPTDAVTQVLHILKGIYEPQGINVPDPIQTVCTRWGSDPFSLGSYSNVAVGASGDDYDILAENVGDGRLFFAGEATNRRYPATMHGAFLSGLREAASMVHHAKARALRVKVERSPSKDAQSCAALLADLFREPDLEFGSFAVIFTKQSSDPRSTAILRVTFSGPRKKTNEGSKTDQQHSNKLLFQQLQSHYNQQQQLHVYTLLSKQHALELREVRGGDESRMQYLSEKLGVKLVGRRGLGSAADSVIASIKAERGIRRSTSSFLAHKSGTLKVRGSAISKQTIVRRAKTVRTGSDSARPQLPPRVKTVNNDSEPTLLSPPGPKPVSSGGSESAPHLSPGPKTVSVGVGDASPPQLLPAHNISSSSSGDPAPPQLLPAHKVSSSSSGDPAPPQLLPAHKISCSSSGDPAPPHPPPRLKSMTIDTVPAIQPPPRPKIVNSFSDLVPSQPPLRLKIVSSASGSAFHHRPLLPKPIGTGSGDPPIQPLRLKIVSSASNPTQPSFRPKTVSSASDSTLPQPIPRLKIVSSASDPTLRQPIPRLKIVSSASNPTLRQPPPVPELVNDSSDPTLCQPLPVPELVNNSSDTTLLQPTPWLNIVSSAADPAPQPPPMPESVSDGSSPALSQPPPMPEMTDGCDLTISQPLSELLAPSDGSDPTNSQSSPRILTLSDGSDPTIFGSPPSDSSDPTIFQPPPWLLSLSDGSDPAFPQPPPS